MSLLSSSKQFQLFDFIPIQDPNYQSIDDLYSNPTLSAINTTSTYLIIAINNHDLKIINPKDLTQLGQFQAYEEEYRITYIEPLHNSNNLIITLAERQGFPSIIKLWDITKMLNLEKLEASEYKFKFQTQVLVNLNDNSYPISCIRFNYDVSCIALGYTHGKVLLIRGDLLRDRGAKQRVIYEGNYDPITNIQCRNDEEILYVTTTSKILTVPTTGRNNGKPLRILSNKSGANLNCTALDNDDLVVGLPECIKFYNATNKLKTINFEVPKSRIYKLGQFLLVVSPEENERLSTRIYIIDLINLHVSFNVLLPNVVTHIFTITGDFYLLGGGVLYKIHEKPINQQIELILQRELFTVAFNLAKQRHLNSDSLIRIENLHGEYLFEQGKYEESIEVFIKCLDLISDEEEGLDEFIMNIITKFKDPINISNLTKFLKVIYVRKLANLDHITLLLCCYCKLKDLDSLDEFIDTLDLSLNLQDLNFQLIINLFKECGFYNQVLKLLYKLNQPSLIVDIQISDLKKPKLALNYMKSLKIDDLLIILIEFSKNLLDSCPIETTDLLIKVFTGIYKPQDQNSKSNELNNDKVEEKEKSVELTNYQSFLSYLKKSAPEDEEPTEEPVSTYSPPKPSLIYSSFTDHPNEFIIFLEACIESFDKFGGNVNDKKELLLTLLELYLSTSQFDKSKSLISNYSNLLDHDSLLLLSHIYKFDLDIEVMDINSLFMKYEIEENIKKLFSILESHGSDNPQLYLQMLQFLISKRSIYESINPDDLKIIITQIMSHRIINILELVNLLSEKEYITLGLIKEQLISFFEDQNSEIYKNEKLIAHYEKESSINSQKLTDLTTENFKISQTKCASCQLKLDYPSVIFKCFHSFHKRCLVGDEACPICYDVKKLQDQQIDEKLFIQKLHNSDDKMKYISGNI
ncbi:unnamed protein product [Candida verbasci]|uniref:E3 ubiquitin-protein ligase PEP5 n=1 Tax=Candida verbasci TaxID=1227364 RepID=A0A9W4TXF9_9ASCO|nr:unnamed protein product [Candida verbasci]